MATLSRTTASGSATTTSRSCGPAGAGIVHCPASNAKLGSGVAPVARYLERGIPVGLATDSVVSNNGLNMFSEMRASVLLQRVASSSLAFTGRDALRAATMGSATVLGLQRKIGSIEPGKRADLVVLRLPASMKPTAENVVSHIVYSADPRDLRAVFVDGKLVVRDGQLVGRDEEADWTADRRYFAGRGIAATGLQPGILSHGRRTGGSTMDLRFTEEQELLRRSVRDFAETVIAPRVQWMEETDQTPTDVIKEMARLGLMGVCIPQQYGGTGMGSVARTIVLEEIGRVSAACAFFLQIFHLGIEPIVAFGSEEQKRKYLPGLASGKRLGTLALTESTGGSDPASLRTEARKDGDSYVLNGRKIFITNAHTADTVVLAARTGEGPKGISLFILEKGMPGFKEGRHEHKFGIHGCDTGELVLEDCRVPAANLLGGEGQGLEDRLRGHRQVRPVRHGGDRAGRARAPAWKPR